MRETKIVFACEAILVTMFARGDAVYISLRVHSLLLALEIGYPPSSSTLIWDLRSRAAHKEFSPPLLSKQQSEEPVQPLLFLINDGSS
eukprot:scaffold11_cov140-Skeletonema_menzelii.AAC.7